MKYLVFLLLVLMVFSGCALFEKEPRPSQAGDQNNGGAQPDQNALDQNADIPDVGQGDQNQWQEPVQLCAGKITVAETDQCFFEKALAEKSSADCNALRVKNKNSCLYEVSLESGQKQDCVLIKDTGMKNNCLNRLAVMSGDSGLCGEISSNNSLKNACVAEVEKQVLEGDCSFVLDQFIKADCLSGKAKRESNYLVCGLIPGTIRQNKFQRDACLDEFFEFFADQKPCSLYFSSMSANQCYYSVATKTGLAGLCETLADDQNKSDCLNKVAVKNNDQTVCGTIPVTTVQQECYSFFAQKSPLPEFCSVILDSAIKKECYKDAGIIALDDTICDLISSVKSEERTTCYVEIATDTNNSSTCKKIDLANFDAKDECYSTIALNLSDYSLCEEVHFGQNYVSCFSSIAVKQNDQAICAKMKKDFITNLGFNPKFGCYKEFAITKKDISLCEPITPQGIKSECQAEIVAQS